MTNLTSIQTSISTVRNNSATSMVEKVLMPNLTDIRTALEAHLTVETCNRLFKGKPSPTNNIDKIIDFITYTPKVAVLTALLGKFCRTSESVTQSNIYDLLKKMSVSSKYDEIVKTNFTQVLEAIEKGVKIEAPKGDEVKAPKSSTDAIVEDANVEAPKGSKKTVKA